MSKFTEKQMMVFNWLKFDLKNGSNLFQSIAYLGDPDFDNEDVYEALISLSEKQKAEIVIEIGKTIK